MNQQENEHLKAFITDHSDASTAFSEVVQTERKIEITREVASAIAQVKATFNHGRTRVRETLPIVEPETLVYDGSMGYFDTKFFNSTQVRRK